MVLYRHVRLELFWKEYKLFKGMFIDDFSPIIIKNKSVNFLMKLVEIPYTFNSLLFSVVKSKCNLSITFIFFWISKQTDLLQSWKLNWASFISQFVNFWVDKPSFEFGVMYLSKSCWMIFQDLYTLFLKSIPLLSL